jgi:hypothetical protein
VTTGTDSDNGGWFRNTSKEGNFWHAFYEVFLNQVHRRETPLHPIFIKDYLDTYGAHGYVSVRPGAWNTGWHNGVDFIQWTGSQMQKDVPKRVHETSEAFYTTRWNLGDDQYDPRPQYQLEEAYWHLLRAETSCNF